MEYFIQWIRDAGSTWNGDWLGVIGTAARASPLLATVVSALALLAAIGSRSLSFTLASALGAALALFAAGMPGLADVEYPLTAAIICIQLLMLAGIWGFRRRIARNRSETHQLLAEKAAVQQRLEEEIRWRRASESTEERVGPTPASTRD